MLFKNLNIQKTIVSGCCHETITWAGQVFSFRQPRKLNLKTTLRFYRLILWLSRASSLALTALAQKIAGFYRKLGFSLNISFLTTLINATEYDSRAATARLRYCSSPFK